MSLSVLHISDLHRDPASPIRNRVLLDSMERDRDRYTYKEDPKIPSPNLIIVSGDIVQGVKHGTPDPESTLRRQYDEAIDFLSDLAKRFVGGDKQRVIIVPGNHDVSDHCFRQCLERVDIAPGKNKSLIAELSKPDSLLRWSWEEFTLYKIADQPRYNQRLAVFGEFYNNFYEGARSYSIDPTEQTDIFDFPDLKITVVGFCSCHNNDLLNRQGAIHPDCIAKAGDALRDICLSHDPLRIAVWHHNTEGPPKEVDYMDPDIVQNLIDSGYSLGFHGHQHKPQFLDTRFRHGPDRRITVISAGTLCGGPAFRFGRAYNVVEIDVEKKEGRLHSREMLNDNLQMPIWGVRAIPPNRNTYQEFKFDSPPEPYIRPSRSTIVLTTAQEMYDRGELPEAAQSLSTIISVDPLARRLFLQILVQLGNREKIITFFNPPESAAEAIALMDALWAEKALDQLKDVLKTAVISGSEDPSVVELREKYAARLKK